MDFICIFTLVPCWFWNSSSQKMLCAQVTNAMHEVCFMLVLCALVHSGLFTRKKLLFHHRNTGFVLLERWSVDSQCRVLKNTCCWTFDVLLFMTIKFQNLFSFNAFSGVFECCFPHFWEAMFIQSVFIHLC